MFDDNRLHYLHGLERKLGEPELLGTYRDGIYEGWGDPMAYPVRWGRGANASSKPLPECRAAESTQGVCE
jgi:hypothetical protein